VLIRLLRGTRPRGLGVLPPRDGYRIRPLYRARRVDVEAHIARHHLPFAVDPSNSDPRYLRARVRRELLPALERLSPRIVEHLCRLADELSQAAANADIAV
jgi:tRNA(Ile)-lysidine synthase